jgi:nucleotidyltransferase/DNA polymerase involved in DNA repair
VWQNTIAHVDLDAFFASVHLKHNPFLKGYPVIIGADPKMGQGRGVVSTCSYEARIQPCQYPLHIVYALKVFTFVLDERYHF